MKKEIKKVLKRLARQQLNLQSESCRDLLAEEISKALGERGHR